MISLLSSAFNLHVSYKLKCPVEISLILHIKSGMNYQTLYFKLFWTSKLVRFKTSVFSIILWHIYYFCTQLYKELRRNMTFAVTMIQIKDSHIENVRQAVVSGSYFTLRVHYNHLSLSPMNNHQVRWSISRMHAHL